MVGWTSHYEGLAEGETERQGLFGIDQQNGVVVVLGNLLEVGVTFSVLEHLGSFICRRR